MKYNIPTALAVLAACVLNSAETPLLLPGEPSVRPAISPFPFPDRLSAFVWRNWFLVPKERLAATVGAQSEDLARIALEMGLPADPEVPPQWRGKGYITVIRRNWHLLDYGQLLTVLDMTREELRYALIEDDFLFVKLGNIKPKCGPLVWTEEIAGRGRKGRLHISRILKEENAADFAEEPRFSFIGELSSPPGAGTDPCASRRRDDSPFALRMVFGYFAEYADPLSDPDVGSYPEGFLRRLAGQGVNAVYLHVVLRTLSKDPAYPEFGQGSETRLAALRTLVDRAARYGIKVFLYLNEPRSMPLDFFTSVPERMALKGVHSKRHAFQHALCTSVPEVRRWLADSAEKVFRAAPGLGGIYTISSDENLSNCASHWNREDCPRCAKRTNAECIAEANAALVEGMRRAAPEAKAIFWDWGWLDDDFDEILEKLPDGNASLMTVSEWGVPVSRGGVSTNVFEYSLSVSGPGERAKRRFAAARRRGFGAVAKVQAGCSWELATVPYLPVNDIVATHAADLARSGADGVLMSWTLGGYPSPNLAIFADCRHGESAGETLERMAKESYGTTAAPCIRSAWKEFSRGFRQFPFFRQTLYEGPQHWGPANPLYPEPTGYIATMVGIPYDDLTHWRWVFTPEALSSQFAKTAEGFEAGIAEWKTAEAKMEAGRRTKAERERALFESAALHFRSAADQTKFVVARDAGDRAAMLAAAKRELETAKRFLPLVRADSRIGFECSNHYFYVPQDVREKILGCRAIIDGESEARKSQPFLKAAKNPSPRR